MFDTDLSLGSWVRYQVLRIAVPLARRVVLSGATEDLEGRVKRLAFTQDQGECKGFMSRRVCVSEGTS